MRKILCAYLIGLFVISGVSLDDVSQNHMANINAHSFSSVAEACIADVLNDNDNAVEATRQSAPITPAVATLRASNTIKPPATTAASILLIDAKTGIRVWRKNANQQQHMASTTKIMTAIVALERNSLDETVTVNSDVLAAGKEGGIKLAVNEKIKLRDLMYALLLESANDAAVAIADHVAGSEAAFAVMMNRKASQLGAKRTHFVNPHGLDHRLHYSTVGDLALFASFAMKDKKFAEIVGTKTWKLTRSDPKLPSVVENTNTLLDTYPGTYGIKTGYTKKARNCLVAGSTKGDKSLICVVLGVKNRKNLFKETASLLDFGFSICKK
jgi:D-alanyl-D-alanine carboxypeptidase (penicillin-binding protein 5/6)